MKRRETGGKRGATRMPLISLRPMLRLGVASLAVLLFCSCVTHVRYVVLDKVPASPTLTVIPASMAGADVETANEITGLLVSCGVRVVERPAMVKEKTQYEGQGAASGYAVGGGQGAIAGGEAAHREDVTKTGDPTALIGETVADYVFIVQGPPESPWLKLVKRDGGQILYAAGLAQESGQRFYEGQFTDASGGPRDAMKRLLEKLGILKD